MKPNCPERLTCPPVTPVLREIPSPTRVAKHFAGEFELPNGALWSADPDTGLRIVCARGQLWVTQAGNADDIVLCAGETFTPAAKGRVVIQALTDARVGLRGRT